MFAAAAIAQKLGIGEADLALAFDAVAALAKEPAITLDGERTKVVVNARVTPTPAFQRNPDLTLDQSLLVRRLGKMSAQLESVDATGLGLALLGDTIAANLFMLGYASQLGLLPVSPEAIERAVEINGVAIPFNKAAFSLGRLQAVDPGRIEQAVAAQVQEIEFQPLTKLEDIVAHRTRLLTDYQNAGWAQRYRDLVDLDAAMIDGSLSDPVEVTKKTYRAISLIWKLVDDEHQFYDWLLSQAEVQNWVVGKLANKV